MSSSDAHSLSSRPGGISTLTPLRASAASRAASAGLSFTFRGSGRAAADWGTLAALAAPKPSEGGPKPCHSGRTASVSAPQTARARTMRVKRETLEVDGCNTAEC